MKKARKRKSQYCQPFGALLQQLRAARKWSAREAARQVGCSPAFFRQMEQGLHSPGLDRLLDIAKAFGLTPAGLMDSLMGKILEGVS